MVKVTYNGHMDTCNIAIKGIRYNGWSKGEAKDLSDELAEILLKNADFKLASGEKSPKKKEVKKEVVEEKTTEKVKFDLDGDGDFDSDDVSLGAQAMAASRKLNKK